MPKLNGDEREDEMRGFLLFGIMFFVLSILCFYKFFRFESMVKKLNRGLIVCERFERRRNHAQIDGDDNKT